MMAALICTGFETNVLKKKRGSDEGECRAEFRVDSLNYFGIQTSGHTVIFPHQVPLKHRVSITVIKY